MADNFTKLTAIKDEQQRTTYVDNSAVEVVEEAPRAGDGKPRSLVTLLIGRDEVVSLTVVGSAATVAAKFDDSGAFVKVNRVAGEDDQRDLFLSPFMISSVSEADSPSGSRPRSQVVYTVGPQNNVATVVGHPGTIVKAVEKALQGDVTPDAPVDPTPDA